MLLLLRAGRAGVHSVVQLAIGATDAVISSTQRSVRERPQTPLTSLSAHADHASARTTYFGGGLGGSPACETVATQLALGGTTAGFSESKSGMVALWHRKLVHHGGYSGGLGVRSTGGRGHIW